MRQRELQRFNRQLYRLSVFRRLFFRLIVNICDVFRKKAAAKRQLVKELNQIVSASLYVFAVFLPVPFVYGFTNPTFPDA